MKRTNNIELILSDVLDALKGIEETERSERVGEILEAVTEDLKHAHGVVVMRELAEEKKREDAIDMVLEGRYAEYTGDE